MSSWKRTRCPCGQDMLWAVSINNKPQPFDAEPSEKGSVLLEEKSGHEPPVARVVTAKNRPAIEAEFAARGETLKLYVPHHATCQRVKDFKTGGSSRRTA
jgi:hypothetical protein